MKHLKAFSVVEFPPALNDTRSTVEAVPSQWIHHGQNLCYWPKDHVHVLVKDEKSVPTQHWESYSITRIFSTHETYQEANKAAHHFERCSDAESESDSYQGRKRVRVGTTSGITKEANLSFNPPPTNLYALQGPHLELVHAEPSTIFQDFSAETRLVEELPITTNLPPPSTPKSSQLQRRRVNLFSQQSSSLPLTFPASSSLPDGKVHAPEIQEIETNEEGSELLLSSNQPPRDEVTDGRSTNQTKKPNQQSEFSIATTTRKPIEKSFEDGVIRQLAKLEANQKEILKTLNSLVSQSGHSSGGVGPEYFASLPEFPISSEAELKSFNEYLGTQDNLERAAKYFSQIGGQSKEQVVREILKRLLSRQIALTTSFTGKGKGNISFSQFSEVWSMILNSTRRNKVSSQSSETEIKKVCMDYFRSKHNVIKQE